MIYNYMLQIILLLRGKEKYFRKEKLKQKGKEITR